MGETITVYIANQHDLIREGLRALMERNGFAVTGTAETLEAALMGVSLARPQVLLLDAALLADSGPHSLVQLRPQSDRMRTLVVTDQPTPEGLVQAVTGGADGYLALTNSAQILAAVHSAATSAQPFDLPTLRAAMTAPPGDPPADAAIPADEAYARFTAAELRVLHLLANGLDNRALADVLDISVNTVKTHMRHIFEKLGVSDRTQAALWASQNGLG